jgi:hypothetical protein
MAMITMDRPTTDDLRVLERWAGWMFELLHEASDRTDDARTQATLTGAAEDALALRRAFKDAGYGKLADDQTVVLASIFHLWEVNQDRYERLAAEVDPLGHRLWLARSATSRLLFEAQKAQLLAS